MTAAKVFATLILNLCLILMSPQRGFAEPQDLSWVEEAKFSEKLRSQSQHTLEQLDEATFNELRTASLQFRNVELTCGAISLTASVMTGFTAYKLIPAKQMRFRSLGIGFGLCSALLLVTTGMFVFDALQGITSTHQMTLEDLKATLANRDQTYLAEAEEKLEMLERFVRVKPLYLQIPQTLKLAPALRVKSNMQQPPLDRFDTPTLFEPSSGFLASEPPLYIEIPSEPARALLGLTLISLVMVEFLSKAPANASPTVFDLSGISDQKQNPTNLGSTLDLFWIPVDGENVEQIPQLIRYQLSVDDILFQIEHNEELEGDGLFLPMAIDNSGFRKRSG